MEQIKEFEKRMDAALDHIAVHLKSSPQAGEKKITLSLNLTR